MSSPEIKAQFIIDHAGRLVKVASMCVISFGLADGLNELLKAGKEEPNSDRIQSIAGFHDGTLMMAVLRVALLLDKDEKVVSFQTIYHQIKQADVQRALNAELDARYSLDGFFGPTRDELIQQFINAYARIDWRAYGRLVHFRNLGVAHLTPQRLQKSVTYGELRAFVEIISELTETLQHMCHTDTAYQRFMLDDYKEKAVSTLLSHQ